MPRASRSAVTLLEILVGIAILGVFAGLVLPAVQRVRAAAHRSHCQNNLRQIGQGAHGYHNENGLLPPGLRYDKGTAPLLLSGWQLHLLPYVDQPGLWAEALKAYQVSPSPFNNPPHAGLATLVPLFICPAEPRAGALQFSPVLNGSAAFTCYLGVSGRDVKTLDGVLFRDSRVRFGDIRDGLSTTLLAGERPPSPDYEWGWWYAGVGQEFTGSVDMLLGVEELNIFSTVIYPCPAGPYNFKPARADDACAIFHFWSQHPGGAHFLFCDGSVRFAPYTSVSLLPALASRAGHESVGLDF